MIRHVVLLHWKIGTTEQAVQQVTEALAKMPTMIPQIRAYQFGPDLGVADTNADYVIVADFENELDFKAYVEHPDHAGLMTEVTMPILESFDSAQFQL